MPVSLRARALTGTALSGSRRGPAPMRNARRCPQGMTAVSLIARVGASKELSLER